MVQQNERMVAANTLPILDFGGSEIDAKTGAPRLAMTLKNGGVGPALIDWFEIRYKGISYGSMGAVLQACCKSVALKGQRLPLGVYYSNVSGEILPARDSLDVAVVTDKAPTGLDRDLDLARQDFEARACYCSVLDECWMTNFTSGRPKPVKSCVVPKDVKPW